MNDRTLQDLVYLFLLVASLLAIGGVLWLGYIAYGVIFEEESCKVRWQASSIKVVNGKPTKPYVTTNCNPSGNPQKGTKP